MRKMTTKNSQKARQTRPPAATSNRPPAIAGSASRMVSGV